MWTLILLAFAFVLFCIAAWNPPVARPNIIAAGLAFMALAFLVERAAGSINLPR